MRGVGGSGEDKHLHSLVLDCPLSSEYNYGPRYTNGRQLQHAFSAFLQHLMCETHIFFHCDEIFQIEKRKKTASQDTTCIYRSCLESAETKTTAAIFALTPAVFVSSPPPTLVMELKSSVQAGRSDTSKVRPRRWRGLTAAQYRLQNI